MVDTTELVEKLVIEKRDLSERMSIMSTVLVAIVKKSGGKIEVSAEDIEASQGSGVQLTPNDDGSVTLEIG